MGGRGANSGAMGGGFTSAGNGGQTGMNLGVSKFPAELNTQGRYASVDGAVNIFRDKYAKANIEYGAVIDESGFAHHHVVGNGTSVSIPSINQPFTTIHNHPSGTDAFSSGDLSSFAATRLEKTMVVVAKQGDVKITKNKNFNSIGFTKAFKKAKWPSNLNYADGADWWLSRNATKYGYSFTRTKAK